MTYQEQKDFEELAATVAALRTFQAIRDELTETLASFVRNPSATNYTKHTEAMMHWQNWQLLIESP